MALICILVVHFNATVTGYFTLPHKIFTSNLPLGIYLGDFGSSLFFIVSGASLALTVPEEQSPPQFYKKRARAVYPLFWLAWLVVFSCRFITRPGSFGGARTVTLVLTFLGLDNFAVAAGWVGMDFACVGEWFLGSILFLYLLFPFLQRALRKNAWLTWAVTLAVCIPVHLLGWDARLVAVHIPEFLFGMTFLMLPKKAQYILAPALLVAAIPAKGWDGKITCALASMGVFILLALVSPLLDRPWPRALGAELAKISYAVFLCIMCSSRIWHPTLTWRRSPAGTQRSSSLSIWRQLLPRPRRCSGCKQPCAGRLPNCAPRHKTCCPLFLSKNSGYFFNIVHLRPLYKNRQVRYNK